MGIKRATEADTLRQLLQWLALHGVFAWRQNSGCTKIGGRFIRFNSEPGMSDIVGILPGGRVLCAEVKKPGGRATAAQLSFLDHVNAAGGLGLVVDGVEKLEQALRLEGVL